MNIDEVEARLVDACEKAIAEGWRIRPCTTMRTASKECCVLGATVIGQLTGFGVCDDIVRVTGLTGKEVRAIAGGFDGAEPCRFSDVDGYALGARLRARYVKP